MASELKISGFDAFGNKLRNLKPLTEKKVSAAVLDAGKNWEQLAKKAAPTDQGVLKRGITTTLISPMEAEVSVNASHARFVEFGTKKRKFVPADLIGYESSLVYNKTGDYYDFLNAILDWVKRKGIGTTYSVKTRRKNSVTKDALLQTAQAIANSISRHGVKPHPFFFPQRPLVQKKLNDEINRYLKTEQ